MTAHHLRRWRRRSPQTWPAPSRSSTHPPRPWAAHAAAGAVQALPIEVAAGSASTSLPRAEAGVELDVAATVAAAMAVGRHGLVDGNRVVAWTRGIEIPWRARVNDARLARLLADLDRRAGHPIREPSLRVGT